MFESNEKGFNPNLRVHTLDTLLSLGQVRRITIEFRNDYCGHSTKPSQIYWRDIPILRVKCLGTECDIRIQNNKQEVIFFLMKNVIKLPFVRFISILLELRLPSWETLYEFAFVLNSEGKMFITPTSHNISAVDLKKLTKYVTAQASKKFEKEIDEDLLDILLPETIPLRDFKIRI
ncbi:hypothetical protein CEE45_02610 [Candidatus Heimdallarchaeota archaeon B3_Heim]|nr:MAG: hypothetical protein CEE45_02610 [Candidatus Heimdallarchaeota archaeon B3_Heim]